MRSAVFLLFTLLWISSTLLGTEGRNAATKAETGAFVDRGNAKDPLDLSVPELHQNKTDGTAKTTTLASTTTTTPSSTTTSTTTVATTTAGTTTKISSQTEDTTKRPTLPPNKEESIQAIENNDSNKTNMVETDPSKQTTVGTTTLLETTPTTTTTDASTTTTTSQEISTTVTIAVDTTKKPAFIIPDQSSNETPIAAENDDKIETTPIKLPVTNNSTGVTSNDKPVATLPQTNPSQEETSSLGNGLDVLTEIANQVLSVPGTGQPCDSNPCKNAGMCINVGHDHFMCKCSHLFIGDSCEVSMLSSGVYDSSTCRKQCVNGQCKRYTDGTSHCICGQGWVGPSCRIPENTLKEDFFAWMQNDDVNLWNAVRTSASAGVCKNNQCTHYGVCLAKDEATYHCQCPPEYAGRYCEKHVDILCRDNPCKHGATCEVMGQNHLTCRCTDNHYGPLCEHTENACSSTPCQHGGKCHTLQQGFRCICLGGFSGDVCEVEANNACEDNPCKNGGECSSSGSDRFTCKCPVGYVGANCDIAYVNPCDSNRCQHHSNCTVNRANNTNYTCVCKEKYKGEFCETRIHPCDSKPCGDHGECHNKEENFQCDCEKGFTGTQCEVPITCLMRSCYNGGSCVKSHDTHACKCAPGYGGERCESITNACALADCQNGATCLNMEDGKSYGCNCAPGFVGLKCEKASPCKPNPCRNDANCTVLDEGDSFQCHCDKYYHGELCEKPKHPLPPYKRIHPTVLTHLRQRRSLLSFDEETEKCGEKTCHNGGVCINRGEEHICICMPDFYGDTCTERTKENHCTGRNCVNGGICQNAEKGNTTCVCPVTYAGPRCQYFRNPCRHKPCQNHRVCHPQYRDLIHGYTCLDFGPSRKNHTKSPHTRNTEVDASRAAILFVGVLFVGMFVCLLCCIRNIGGSERHQRDDINERSYHLQRWRHRLWQRLQNPYNKMEEGYQMHTVMS